VRSLDVQCHQCRHRVIVNVDHLHGDLTVPSFGPKMVHQVRDDWRRRAAELAGAAAA
jgi:DNA-directed RNA polymerase subunit RPC12/RpoP